MDDYTLTIRDLMAETGYTYAGLSILRYNGRGPDYRKSGKFVFYSRSSVQAWLAARPKRNRCRRELQEQRRNIVDMRSNGARYADIRAKLGVGHGCIADALETSSSIRRRPKIGLDRRIEIVAFAREHTFDAAARHFGLSRRAIIAWSKRPEVQCAPPVSRAIIARNAADRLKKARKSDGAFSKPAEIAENLA